MEGPRLYPDPIEKYMEAIERQCEESFRLATVSKTVAQIKACVREYFLSGYMNSGKDAQGYDYVMKRVMNQSPLHRDLTPGLFLSFVFGERHRRRENEHHFCLPANYIPIIYRFLRLDHTLFGVRHANELINMMFWPEIFCHRDQSLLIHIKELLFGLASSGPVGKQLVMQELAALYKQWTESRRDNVDIRLLTQFMRDIRKMA